MNMGQTLRSLRGRPAFTAAAVLTLALGFAAAIAITMVVDAVVLRPLPYPRADRLYRVNTTLPGPTGEPTPFLLSTAEFVRARAAVSALEQLEAMSAAEMAVIDGREPETVRGATASAGFLALFGLDPIVGRAYTEEEDRTRAAVALLDGGYWERRFGRDPGIIGRRIAVDGVAREIIGVTPAGYQPLLQPVDLWVPLGAQVDPTRPNTRLLLGAARLAAHATEAEARAALQQVSAALADEFPPSHGRARLQLTELGEQLYGPYRPVVLILFGGVTFLVLIACTNVANLALGRVAERGGEIALRLSLGAAPARIMREQLTEMLVVAALGGLLGAIVATAALPALLAIYPDALPRDLDVRINLRVAGVVSLQLIAAAIIAGVLPARRACALPAASVLAAAGPRQIGRSGDHHTREWLLAAQIGFAVALLSTAAMVGLSVQRLSRINPGLDPQGVITMQLAPPARYTDVPGRANFVDRMLERVAAVPGVIAAGTTQTLWQPLTSMQTRLEIERLAGTDEPSFVNVRHITPGYFAALRVGVVEGRAIDARDRLGAPPVAMVSRAFAERYWPGQSALGRRVRRASSGGVTPPWLAIVGVAEDVMDAGLGRDLGPTVYLPYLQQNTLTARVTLVVRTQGDPQALGPAIRRAVWSVDPQQPIDAAQPLDRVLGASIAQPRFGMSLLTAFGLIGLVLASVGVYGVSAYAAAQRRREIAVRLACGATARQIAALLFRQSLVPVLGGITLGLLLTLWAAGYVASIMHGVEGLDAAPLITASAVLAACALVATWVPVRRALRLAPMEVLRLD